MNIHEYQAKELLQKFDVATTRGRVASTLDEAEQIARELGDVEVVVKAQIHAGGRGKGTFKNGFKGGVHVRKTPEKVREVAAQMLGQILVTHQTGPAGRVVNKVLVDESADIAREIYFAILLDRGTAAPLIVASTEGGVEIETVAEKSPEKIMRESVHPLAGLQPFQTRKLAKQLGFESSQSKEAARLFDGRSQSAGGHDKGRRSGAGCEIQFRRQRAVSTPRSSRDARYSRRGSARSRGVETRPELHRLGR